VGYLADVSEIDSGLPHLHRTRHRNSFRGEVAVIENVRLYKTEVSAMKKNMSVLDRVLRTTLAVIVGILYFTGQLTGTAAIILGVFAVIFLATSSVGFCPVYTVLGMSTLKKEA